MHFTKDRLERLQRSLELALNQEWPQLSATQVRLARLRAVPIRICSSSAKRVPLVATVAADGGENNLRLEPIQLQVIRVADNLGKVYFEDFVARSLRPEDILRFFFHSNPRLQRLLDCLRLQWSQLLPRSEFQRSQLFSMLRELMEWAALMELASHPSAKLLIRDGLLRSVLLSDMAFGRLREKLETLTTKHGHLLVGVAKRSRVLSYLSVALDLNASFNNAEPAYLPIPTELECQAAPAQYRWIGSRAMGSLHIARLDRGEGVPLMPVDVAAWQAARTAEVMSLLQESAQASFPLRGYPQALVQAHENARMGGLEVELMVSMLLGKLRDRDASVANAARRLMLVGRKLSEGMTEHEYRET